MSTAGVVYATRRETGVWKIGKGKAHSRAYDARTYCKIIGEPLFWQVADRHEAERKAHKACKHLRVDKKHELFRDVNIKDLITAALGPDQSVVVPDVEKDAEERYKYNRAAWARHPVSREAKLSGWLR